MANASDTAVILDYWGREPGEMVTGVKGHEGLASLISLLMAVTHLQPLDHRVQRLRLGMGWLGGVSMVHLNASLLPFIALKISFSD